MVPQRWVVNGACGIGIVLEGTLCAGVMGKSAGVIERQLGHCHAF